MKRYDDTSGANWVYLNVADVRDKTGDALLLRLKDGRDFWIPRAHIANNSPVEIGDRDLYVAVSKWIYLQKGI